MSPQRLTGVYAAALAAVLGATTACSPTGLVGENADVVIVTTATANDYRPEIGDDLTNHLIRSASVRDSRATVFLSADNTSTKLGDTDLTVLRGNDVEADQTLRREGFQQKVDDLNEILSAATSSSNELDLLSGLADAVQSSNAGTVVVMSSGLQTAGLLDFSRLGWQVDPVAAIDKVEEDNFLPNLANKTVYFAGIGKTTGTQDPLPVPLQEKVVDVWAELCWRAQARACEFIAAGQTDEPAAHNRNMETVTIPPFELEPIAQGQSTTVWNFGNETLFQPDSAELLPSARLELDEVAQRLIERNATISVVGRTWKVGPAQGARRLSLQRAEAVVGHLLSAGLPESAIKDVKGLGYDQLLPAANGKDHASSNRVVTLTVTTS